MTFDDRFFVAWHHEQLTASTATRLTVHGTSGADILLSGTVDATAAAIDIARGQAVGDRNATPICLKNCVAAR
jgi:hypothetical protein